MLTSFVGFQIFTKEYISHNERSCSSKKASLLFPTHKEDAFGIWISKKYMFSFHFIFNLKECNLIWVHFTWFFVTPHPLNIPCSSLYSTILIQKLEKKDVVPLILYGHIHVTTAKPIKYFYFILFYFLREYSSQTM